jgi:ATP-binding protein involved in chromosome partitioning
MTVKNTQLVSQEMVLAALRKVQDPELRRDLVSLNMIRDLKTEGDRVSFTIVLTTPACPLRDTIEQDARQAVAALPGVSVVDIKVDANVPTDGRLSSMLDIPVRNSIAIASGKGGVGKSTVAVNLAVALAQSGARVGLLDADIYGPNVPTMMGLSSPPTLRNKRMVPPERYGVKVISIGFLVPPGQPLIWRGPMLHSAIRQFIGDVEWGELDYMVIDLPPGTGDAQLSLSQSLPLSGGVIVTLPQQVSIDDARRGLEMFRSLDVPVLGVVENMSYLELPDGSRMDIFGSGGGKRLAAEAGVAFIGTIPIDPFVPESGDKGNPIIISHPDSVAAQAMLAVAKDIAAKVSVAALSE